MAKEKKKKKNIFTKIKEFFADVKAESQKVIWTSKKNLVKYSVATLVFILFICLFFVGINELVKLIVKAKELIG